MTDATRQQLSGEQLSELLTLLNAADSVELKLTVPETDQRSAVAALDMDPLAAQLRQVVFFETPDLMLDRLGVVVRARRVQGVGDDSVIKLRPIDPDGMSKRLRSAPNFVIEVDAMPGGYVCSGSLKAQLGRTDVRKVLAGRSPVHTLFTKEQRRFLTAVAPKAPGLDDLTPLGPINVMKLKLAPKHYRRRLVAELWFYPDGSRILELSTKCSPKEAFEVASEVKAYLAGRGIDVSGAQQTKTRTALEYFGRLHTAT